MNVLLIILIAAVATACSEPERVPVTEIQFNDLRIEEISATEAVVRFTTSVPTSCLVNFGTDPDTLDRQETAMMDEPYAIDHEVWLTDLEPETTYHLRPYGEAEDGTTATGELYDFGTLTEVVDDNRFNAAMMDNGGAIMDVSSNWAGAPNDGTFGANLAIDGNIGTEWSSDGDGDDAEVTIGFNVSHIVGFAFRSRKMTDGTSIVRSVQLFDDADNDLGTYETPDPDQTYEFMFDAPVETTSIRFEAVETSGGNTGAKEIMVWASPTPKE